MQGRLSSGVLEQKTRLVASENSLWFSNTVSTLTSSSVCLKHLPLHAEELTPKSFPKHRADAFSRKPSMIALSGLLDTASCASARTCTTGISF
jgi:hypothetical protein